GVVDDHGASLDADASAATRRMIFGDRAIGDCDSVGSVIDVNAAAANCQAVGNRQVLESRIADGRFKIKMTLLVQVDRDSLRGTRNRPDDRDAVGDLRQRSEQLDGAGERHVFSAYDMIEHNRVAGGSVAVGLIDRITQTAGARIGKRADEEHRRSDAGFERFDAGVQNFHASEPVSYLNDWSLL